MTDFDTTQIEQKCTDEYCHLQDRIQQHTTRRIQCEISDSRHGDQGPEGKCESFRDCAEQDGRAHPGQRPRHTLFRRQVEWYRLGINGIVVRFELGATRSGRGGGSVVKRLFWRRCVGTMEHVLPIEFVDEDEYVVNANSQDEERNDFSDDEGHFDTDGGEEPDRSRDGKNDEGDAEESESELRSNEQFPR